MDIPKKIGVGCGVMILHEGKVLMGLRHSDKEKADSELHGEGTWTFPGGKMHFGESFEEAAAREVKEECDIDISLSDFDIICVNNDKVNDAHFVTVGLFARNFFGSPKIMEPDEITEWKWFSFDNLPQKIFFPTKRMIENYQNKKFYIKRD